MPENAPEFREHARTCHKNNRVLAPRPADQVLVTRIVMMHLAIVNLYLKLVTRGEKCVREARR
eukprot:252806-Prymnesium_polylepis.1